MKNLLLSLICLSFYFSAGAQCVVEIPLSQRANASSLIVEGKVINQHSFWNANNTMIYTSSEVEIYKIFKGSVSTSTISIISEGGIVGLTKITAEPALNLHIDDIGVFTCAPPTHMRNLPVNTTGIPQFEAFASVQGFIKYDMVSETAADAFHIYNHIESELYPVVLEPNRLTYAEIQPFTIHSSAVNHNGPQNPNVQAITGFAPTTVTAGTGTTITITGSSFGATQGSGTVRFRNADDGGATLITPLASQYISWSSTQIVVEVPQNAGTGTIQVVQGSTFTSAQTLTVSYAHLNVDFDPGSGTEAYGTDHIDDNGSGGYTWRMNTAFDADAAMKASFMRAFDTWRCATGVNWTIGATTSINDAISDGTNVICEDAAAPLSAGILGVCYSYWSGCASGPTIVWYVNELDIIFDDGSNISPLTWEYGTALPSGSEYDFETVAVHELGHGHQLGHVINNGAIMHYAISNGTSNRSLDPDDLAGGNFIQSKSVVANVCGPGAMTNHSCAVAPVAAFSGTPTTLCAGGTVAFTDQSTNTPTSWSWTFQGGTPSSSTAQNPTITYSTPGTYSVSLTATNASGSDNESIVGYITVNANPNATSSSVTNISCNGGSDGSATVGVSGGTPAYSYNWTPGNPTGDGTVTVTGLSTGTYTCTVTDANTCTDSQTFTITQPTAITFTSNTQTNISCNGGSDGTASVNAATGGAGGFTYDWTPGTPTGDGTIAVTGLAMGTYTCTATDINGCTATRTFSITEPAVLDAVRTTNNVTCFGLNDGSCNVAPTGGTPGYTYSWSPLGGTGATASNLAAGSYTCTITDANGCTRNKNFLVTQPTPISGFPSQSDATCNGVSDGSATVAPTGGTPGYTYSWAPSGGTGATANNIAAGNYTCTITDANGCTLQETFVITEPLAIIVTMSGSDENCNSTDGTATATPSQGNAPYTYVWAPGGQTTQGITNLAAGTYTCTVTDATGCSNSNTFTVNNIGCSGPPVAAFSGTPTTVCAGSTVAFTNLSTNTPTSWTWSFSGGSPSGSNAQNPTITYSTPGTYDVTLTATNASGSDGETMIGYITVVAPPSASGSVTNVSCFGGNDGAIDVTPSGNSPFTYVWNPSGQTTEDRTNLTNGSYSVTVTDVNGCTFQTSFSVNQPTVLSRIMSKTDASCSNNDGTATATPSGGTAPYTYLWSPGGQATQTATGLASGSYTCTITDANGCTVNGSISVGLVCGTTRLTNATCGITLSSLSQQVFCIPVSGATNYRYRWINAAQGFNFVFVRNSNQTNCWGTWITGIQYGRTYTVEVSAFVGSTWSAYGPVCTVTTPAAIPTIQLIASDCGSSVASLSELIYATPVSGASQYEWRVSHPATSFSVTYLRIANTADLRMQWINGIQYGLTYNVEVRAYVNGVWGTFGPVCTVTTPPFPTTQLTSTYCGATTAAVSSPIYCNPVQNATNYQWKFINTSIGYSSTMMRGSALTSWYMNSNGGILTNTTYTVTVRAYVGGVWGTFGPPCTITTGPVQIAPNESQAEAMRAQEEICAANPGVCASIELTMDVYPNPFAENITVMTDASVRAVLIYNSFGEFVRSVDLENGKAEINLGDLASGIYLIQATTAEGVITKRVVKQ